MAKQRIGMTALSAAQKPSGAAMLLCRLRCGFAEHGALFTFSTCTAPAPPREVTESKTSQQAAAIKGRIKQGESNRFQIVGSCKRPNKPSDKNHVLCKQNKQLSGSGEKDCTGSDFLFRFFRQQATAAEQIAGRRNITNSAGSAQPGHSRPTAETAAKGTVAAAI